VANNKWDKERPSEDISIVDVEIFTNPFDEPFVPGSYSVP
jgi:hypothetical protein